MSREYPIFSFFSYSSFISRITMSSLQDYLAQNYLVASKAGDFGNDSDGGNGGGADYEDSTRKKKKKKSKKSTKPETSSVVNDDDDDVFKYSNRDVDEDELDGPAMESIKQTTTEAKRKWKKLGGTETSETLDTAEPAPTDTLAAAQHGLQTPDQVALYLQRKLETEAEMVKQLGEAGPSNETVYRDASGRRIDILSVRAEARQKERKEAEEREKMHRDLNRGLVQKQKSTRNLQEEDVKYTRNVDDADRNNEMKNKVDSFHDPAASFLTKKSKRKGASTGDTSVTGRRLYQGHFAPNRFGIVPGHRWDGVDRSNGFEDLWFKKQNEIQEKKKLEYSMSYDM